MTDVVLVEIGDVRIHRIIVEIHVGVGFLGFEPGILHGNIVHGFGRSAFLLARLARPIVAIVADGHDDLLARHDGESLLEVVDEPILTGNGAGLAAGIMLVVVHQDEAVGKLRDTGVVELLVVDGNGDVELQST